MYKTPKELGLSQQEIDRIAEDLWLDVKQTSCPDCGVKVHQTHLRGCDIERCTKCGTQRISCLCKVKGKNREVWSGIFPGVKECYEQKLICIVGDNQWTFDLNSYYSTKNS